MRSFLVIAITALSCSYGDERASSRLLEEAMITHSSEAHVRELEGVSVSCGSIQDKAIDGVWVCESNTPPTTSCFIEQPPYVFYDIDAIQVHSTCGYKIEKVKYPLQKNEICSGWTSESSNGCYTYFGDFCGSTRFTPNVYQYIRVDWVNESGYTYCFEYNSRFIECIDYYILSVKSYRE
jgi:hypothetical protein